MEKQLFTNIKTKIVHTFISLFFILFFIFSLAFTQFSLVFAQNNSQNNASNTSIQDNQSIVQCGWDSPCTIADLFNASNNLAGVIIKIFFPALFFIGAFISILPMVKDAYSPENRAESKRRFKILLIGSTLIIGAYIIIKSVLSFIGVKNDIIQKTLSQNNNINIIEHFNHQYNSLFIFDTAYAIDNPLNNTSIQGILLTVINGVVFIAMIIGAYCVVRGGFMLVWFYQDPNNAKGDALQKAKWWIIAGLIIWTIFLGGQYFINIIFNTVTDFGK